MIQVIALLASATAKIKQRSFLIWAMSSVTEAKLSQPHSEFVT